MLNIVPFTRKSPERCDSLFIVFKFINQIYILLQNAGCVLVKKARMQYYITNDKKFPLVSIFFEYLLIYKIFLNRLTEKKYWISRTRFRSKGYLKVILEA